jgi:kinesin family protein 18/19
MSNPNVIVAVRIRPCNSTEYSNANHRELICPIDQQLLVFDPADNYPSSNNIYASARKQQLKSAQKLNGGRRAKDLKYAFDYVFDSNSSQAQVYEHTAKKVINSVLDGENCTVFAYVSPPSST